METVFKVAFLVGLFAVCAWAVNAVITPFIDAFEDIKRIREILEDERIKMTDAETRAELERIKLGAFYQCLWDTTEDTDILDLLRLLAEQHKALREIGEKTTEIITHPPNPGPTLPIMLANTLVAVNRIAKTAIKEK